MSVWVLIGFGYLFNLICVILYALMFLIYKVNVTLLSEKQNILKKKQIDLISQGIDPFRSEDYIIFLPFGYGVFLISKMLQTPDNFRKYIYDYITEKAEYYKTLEGKE